MIGDEIRAAFLSFFEEKGHKVIPSSSLIPQGDPTLLLTSAGMVQFKPYFLGEALPPNPRLVSAQKCFRTTDIGSVGDTSHLTFFEMLGNFSVGDYFKQEAIFWAWEFVTQRLRLEPERLWITIFLDDDEAFGFWRKLGIPEGKILRSGEKDNFWGPAGDSGPCGPCSEIHYDLGEEVGCGKDTCAPNCDCGRFSEIWNLVFVQYNQDKEGNHTLLPKPNIDTGMGLERTAAVMQGKTSVYETDLFVPLVQGISELVGKRYGDDEDMDNAIRIIAEHSRGIAFLIADGVLPSNEGRGYVLRRLLRRAALFGRRFGLNRPFLGGIAGVTVGRMAEVYPELWRRQNFIYAVIEHEEAKFQETLSTGLEIIENVMSQEASQKARQISGEDAFRLYDTYGFPVELTREVVAKSGFSVDMASFDKEMEKQRERARAAHKFESVVNDLVYFGQLNVGGTSFVGYHSLEQKATIVKLLVESGEAGTIEAGQEAGIILDTTPFYAEMGGQVGDSGEIQGTSGRFLSTDTIRVPPDIVVHLGSVAQGSLAVGDEVEAKVDEERRLDIARNHTATHLLQLVLRKVLGEHVQQRGSVVTPDQFRFDFSHLATMTKEEVAEVQHIVNEKIRLNLRVFDQELSYKQAIDEGAIALFDEKYADVVRVVKIGRPAISAELCGGTHVTTTGEIGFFQIVTETSIGAGLRRIEAVTGRGAEAAIKESIDTLLDEVSAKQVELEKAFKRAQALERELARREAESLLEQVEIVGGTRILATRVTSSRQETLREMIDVLREKLTSAVIVLGTIYENKPAFIAAVTPDLVKKGYHAADIVSRVAGAAGGGGGGKASLAQGGGKDKGKLDEALRLAKSLM
jgi:alanyl-tRNA synthetase